MAATVDHVSAGRLILGMGAGWFEREHDAFGLDFGSGFGERLDRLIEAVPLLRRLLDGETGPTTAASTRSTMPSARRGPSRRTCRS